MPNSVKTRAVKPSADRAPHYIWHESFACRSSLAEYDPAGAPSTETQSMLGHLPDDETRDIVRRMHFAAYRADRARTSAERHDWKRTYFQLRDRVVLGNRKLSFRAIRKNSLVQQMADDLIGECDIIMIRAVAAYNPWLGIRFSTYAFTCLMRGLARLSRRVAAKRLINFLPLDAAPDDDVGAPAAVPNLGGELPPFDEFFRSEHALLTHREKVVLSRRFGFNSDDRRSTLETLGADLGISKERVRQVQTSAIEKLRHALADNSAVNPESV